jgi:hypothetical protein
MMDEVERALGDAGKGGNGGNPANFDGRGDHGVAVHLLLLDQ